MSGDFPSAYGQVRPGAQIASYRLVEQVGRGGMAVVYRALDLRLDRLVALKILAPEIASDEPFRQRFIRESRAAAAVDHPHIIPIFEAGQADELLFIAMRYVSGLDVRTLLDREGTLPPSRTVSIVSQVASALDAAHLARLIHRDVKPGNILLDTVSGSGRTDHVYLSDFGLSKLSASSAVSLTSAGQFLGTPDYIAPEQISGRPADGRSDLYALACTAFEMLSGEPPFRRDRGVAVMWAQVSEPPPQLSARRPDLPVALDQLFTKALAKSPDDRYQTCLDFAAALTAACVPPPRPPAGPQPGTSGQPSPATELAKAVGASAGPPGPSRSADPAYPARPSRSADPAYPAGPSRSADPAYPAGPSRSADPAYPAGPATHAAYSARTPPQAAPYPERRQVRPTAPELTPPLPPAARGYSRARRPWWRSAGALVVGCVILIGLAAGAFALSRGGARAQPPLSHASSSVTTSQTGSTPSGVLGPAATVTAYFTAINDHDYTRAWSLGGKNLGSPYSAFVQGYSATASDNTTILSVSGNVVTVRIVATQTDGTTKTFQGTYTVTDGAITRSHVLQTS